MLRQLSRTGTGSRWHRQFGLLRESLTETGSVPAHTPGMIPGLLALCQAQPEHRREYLGFLEICHDLPLLAPETDRALLESVQAEVAAGEHRYAAYLLHDDSPEVRAAAARLLSRFPQTSHATREALSLALTMDRCPAVVGEALAALHFAGWQSRRPAWAPRLEAFITPLNPPLVRFRAACLRLSSPETVSTALFARIVRALAANLYAEHSGVQYPSRALALVQAASRPLDRERAVELWIALLAASREFDGAIELSLNLLRTAFRDERQGWEEMSLSVRHRSGGPVESPNLFAAIVRLAWAGLHHRLTGNFPTSKLRKHHRPSRDYTAIRAFPPGLDLTDPCQARAIHAIAGAHAPWLGFTNLWTLFGLPSRRLEMQLLVNESGQ